MEINLLFSSLNILKQTYLLGATDSPFLNVSVPAFITFFFLLLLCSFLFF